jgi:hypothetical protein
VSTKLSAVYSAMDRPVKERDGWLAECPVCDRSATVIVDFVGGVKLDFNCDCPDALRFELLGFNPAAVHPIVDDMFTTAPAPSANGEDKEPKQSPAAKIVRYAQERYRLGRSTEGLLFALPKDPGAARVATEIRALKAPLSARLWEESGMVPARDAMSNALGVLEGLASSRDAEPVAIRSAVRGDTLFLDLGDSTGRIVRVTASGWTVEDPADDHPVFRRSAAMMQLPEPTRGGDVHDLRQLLRFEDGDQRWLLAYGWLVSSLFEDVSRPLLWCSGPQGSGKSTAARMLINIVDPRDALGGQPGKNLRDDTTALKARYVASWDNISAVSQAVSDWFCRIVTGGAAEERELFSNDGFRAISIQRTGVATSLYLPPGLRADAMERVVHVQYERMADTARASETALWAEYLEAQPHILGALLDDVSAVLRYRPQAVAQERARPRMADHSNILAALDMARGDADEAFRSAYCGVVDTALADKALDDPFALAILHVVAKNGGEWIGTAKALLRAASDEYRADSGDDPDRVRMPNWWPTNPRAVTAQLVAASEALKHAGVAVDRSLPKTKAGKPIKLSATKELDVDLPDAPPLSTELGFVPGE